MDTKKLLEVNRDIIKAQENIIHELQGVISEQNNIIDRMSDALVLFKESIDKVEKSDY